METKTDRLVSRTKMSDSDIVPEDYQNILIYLRDSITSACFAIGDIANDLVSKSLDAGLPVTDQRIFEAVGKYCGKSPRTVRYYAETSAFYDKEVRQEYETLPFSFFVFARSMNGKWKEVLDFASNNQGSTLEYLKYIFLASLQVDGNKSWETSQDLDEVGNGENVRNFANDSVGAEVEVKSCEHSQDNLRISKHGLISALGRYMDASKELLGVIASSGVDVDSILLDVENIEEAIKSASDIATKVNSMYNSVAG